MKKLLLIILLCALGVQVQASHLMGGQMTSQNIGGLYYEITLILYRDSLGIPMNPQQQITYTDSSGNFVIGTHFVNYYPNFTTNIGNGVERYVFVDTITFPYAGKFRAFTSNCCRNAAILNLPNPGSNSMWLDVEILADTSNSSPVFLNEPITVAQLNQPFSYNPSPFDVDGDSLSWQLDNPMDVSSTTLGFPIPGYVLPYSDSLIPFTLDPLTGEITFLPNTVGNFQVSVKAVEWRNGLPIGFIRRDMQLIVVPSVNMPVLISTVYTTMRTTTQPIYVQPNQQLSFELYSYNTDMGQTTISTSGSIFIGTNPASVLLSSIDSVGNMVTTNTVVGWTPNVTQVSDDPYYLVFRVGDPSGPFVFYNDYTFRVFVSNSSTGVSEININQNKKFIKSVDVLGREIDPNSYGFRIDIYNDGTTKKFYKQ